MTLRCRHCAVCHHWWQTILFVLLVVSAFVISNVIAEQGGYSGSGVPATRAGYSDGGYKSSNGAGYQFNQLGPTSGPTGGYGNGNQVPAPGPSGGYGGGNQVPSGGYGGGNSVPPSAGRASGGYGGGNQVPTPSAGRPSGGYSSGYTDPGPTATGFSNKGGYGNEPKPTRPPARLPPSRPPPIGENNGQNGDEYDYIDPSPPPVSPNRGFVTSTAASPISTDKNQWDIRDSIPGQPGTDYPILWKIPQTSFSCLGKNSGYYADPETRCQVFHRCEACSDQPGVLQQLDFLCPNGTIFNQQILTCDWWGNVECETSEQFFGINNQIRAKNPDGGYAQIDLFRRPPSSPKLAPKIIPPEQRQPLPPGFSSNHDDGGGHHDGSSSNKVSQPAAPNNRNLQGNGTPRLPTTRRPSTTRVPPPQLPPPPPPRPQQTPASQAPKSFQTDDNFSDYFDDPLAVEYRNRQPQRQRDREPLDTTAFNAQYRTNADLTHQQPRKPEGFIVNRQPTERNNQGNFQNVPPPPPVPSTVLSTTDRSVSNTFGGVQPPKQQQQYQPSERFSPPAAEAVGGPTPVVQERGPLYPNRQQQPNNDYSPPNGNNFGPAGQPPQDRPYQTPSNSYGPPNTGNNFPLPPNNRPPSTANGFSAPPSSAYGPPGASNGFPAPLSSAYGAPSAANSFLAPPGSAYGPPSASNSLPPPPNNAYGVPNVNSTGPSTQLPQSPSYEPPGSPYGPPNTATSLPAPPSNAYGQPNSNSFGSSTQLPQNPSYDTSSSVYGPQNTAYNSPAPPSSAYDQPNVNNFSPPPQLPQNPSYETRDSSYGPPNTANNFPAPPNGGYGASNVKTFGLLEQLPLSRSNEPPSSSYGPPNTVNSQSGAVDVGQAFQQYNAEPRNTLNGVGESTAGESPFAGGVDYQPLPHSASAYYSEAPDWNDEPAQNYIIELHPVYDLHPRYHRQPDNPLVPRNSTSNKSSFTDFPSDYFPPANNNKTSSDLSRFVTAPPLPPPLDSYQPVPDNHYRKPSRGYGNDEKDRERSKQSVNAQQQPQQKPQDNFGAYPANP